MNLVIDYGNSSAKVGIFDHHELVRKEVFTEPGLLKNFLENFSADYIIVSSVTTDASLVCSWAKQVKEKYILTHTLPLPIKNGYATPLTLGVDRIAGVCGARQHFPNRNSLVIDLGTCVTYDFIDSEGVFLGGGISPGLSMRFEAVHTFTAKLPLVQVVEDASLIGNSTETCIQSGVLNGMIEELNGIIGRYQEKFQGLQVILCGGDARFFENKVKGSIFALPELVLSGLNSILIYNVNQ
jgi:type III pantothenate kinase